uniref:Uncharacterized protein n=1 Tax=Lactuca sativa TaxID=4236 RepID=A0A9R1WMV0_LACSA|nr:hypothetical protein LSAT_V11C100003850 [Lactuca sativa]
MVIRMGDQEFAKAHNSAIFLEDPPVAHSDMKFIMDGLKKSCLVHALTTSHAIYQSLIKEFWRNVVVKKNGQGDKFVEATIEEKKIQVTESIIRESLQISDRPEYTMEIDIHQTQDVMEHMGYEGTFPPTIKKLLPPCWKYLAHVFVSCISGRRSGANGISLANTGAIVALAAGFEFNFSKFILNEMILNLEGNKRDKFWMYPRFLQIILNVNHAELQRGDDVLDFKSIGPSAFGLMKQKRGGKFVFEGKFLLIKFGIFKEDGRDESEEQSMPMENEDTHHSPSEPEVEEIHHSPTACVADEHEYQKANDSKSSQGYDDDNLYDNVELLKEIDFTGINDNIPANIEFDLNDEDFDPFLGIPSSRANKVNEVVSLATKTRVEEDSLKILLSTSKPLEVTTSQGDVTSEIPPSVSLVSTSAPIISDLSEPHTSQTSLRTSQSLESLEIPAVKSAPQVTSTITATFAHSPPKQTNEGPSTMFETEYSPTRPSLDEASIRLVRHLAQSSPTSSRGKGISFNEGRTDDDKFSSSDLREEVGVLRQQLIEKSIQMDQLSAYIFELRAKDEEKTKQIKDLQTSLGSVLANCFNLKNVLYDAFGEKVKALFQQPHGVVDPPSAQSPPAIDDLPVDPAAPRTTTIVDRFENEPEGSRARITIKRGKRVVTTKHREGLLFMKNTNENRKAKEPSLTVKENFPSMKTAKARYRKDKDALDPETGKPMKIILWPATKKQKDIPIPQHFQEGYLDNMEFWAYDDETATAAIKFKDQERVLRLINAKDLLRFRERDIRTLARHQIICRKEIMEAASKEYTAMVATIINGSLWMGSMGRSDLRLFEKPAEEPKE